MLDAFTPARYGDFQDRLVASYEKAGGFWRAEAYLCLQKDKIYPGGVYLEGYTVVTEEDCQNYNLWNQAFTQATLGEELADGGFGKVDFFANVKGDPWQESSETLCALAKKDS